MARFSQEKGFNETFVAPSRDSSGNIDFTEVDVQNSRNYVQSNKIVPVRVMSTSGNSAQQVKITDGTDLVTVNTDGSMNVTSFREYLAINGTLVLRNNQSTAAGSTTIYTVTAGKTLYIVSCWSDILGGGTNNNISLNTDADGTSREFLWNSVGAVVDGGRNISMATFIKVPANKVVQVLRSATCTAQCTGFVGYEI